MVPCWIDQSPSQGVFPKKTLSKSCSEYEVDGGVTFGYGVLDISRARVWEGCHGALLDRSIPKSRSVSQEDSL
jgi:hypothetical protein